jgi:hypothetical protein
MSETESDGYITDEDAVLFGAALDQVQRTREEES